MILLQRFYHQGVPSTVHLLIDGLLASLGGALFGWWLFPAEASLVAVFLAAISCDDSVERVLDDNRAAIFERGISPSRANTRLTLRVLALFAGAILGFGILGMALPLETVQSVFSRQVAYAGPFSELTFGSTSAILARNVYVLLFFFVIAIPFRHGGVMLAIAWNASVWGMTFGVLARDWTLSGGPGPLQAWLRVIAAVGVHMACEAVAYTIAGLAGVFLSKAIGRHAWDSDTMLSIAKTVSLGLFNAAVLVALGAMWEARVAPVLVHWLSGSW